MNKSMLDKAFFLDKIDVTTFVDFGCGDGSLLNFIDTHIEGVNLVGYDNDSSMVEMAAKNNPKISMYHEWQNISQVVKRDPNSALILSSVIHEVYNYSSPKQIEEFWNNVFLTPFKYIIIRDMVPSRHIARPADINDVAKVYKKFLYSQALTDFESIWGSIEDNKNLIHFLLKYKYIEPNWDREVRENYMPIYREDLLALLDIDNYNVMYHEHFVLPYIKQIVLDDFNIDIKDSTHLKLILKRG
jgi:SAM-dependent methyltransferase